MAVRRDDVMRVLRSDEPDYANAAEELGDDAAPILEEFAQSDSVEFAGKAVSLAGFLSPERARPVFQAALAHGDGAVRVAAMAALQRQPELAEELVAAGLGDADPGVRKWTLRTVDAVKPRGLRNLVGDIASGDEEPALRQFASEVARGLPA